jgi:hypothetical protein
MPLYGSFHAGAKEFIDIDDSSEKYANLLPFVR